MNISKLALIASLGGALMAFGCSSDDTNGGGAGGEGGAGGGGLDPLCQSPPAIRCANGTIDEHVVCCEQPVPDQANACLGTESLVNPTSCAETGTTISYLLTLMEVAPDCNVGFNLDDCDGSTCFEGGLAASDGMEGVDNAVSGLAPTLESVGGNLNGVNQALSDTICGMTDDPDAGTCSDSGTCSATVATTCTNRTNCPAGETCAGVTACTSDTDCTAEGSTCTLDDDDCLTEGVPANIRFVIDANTDEGCANVQVSSGDSTPTDVILNLSDDRCLSGELGTIPLTIGEVVGEFTNANVYMTISDMGFSDGLLGITIDEATASAIADALIEDGSQVVTQVLDINVNLTQDTTAACNALSATMIIGGYAEEGTGGNGGNGGGNGQ